MHLAERGYFLIVATALLAIASVWSPDAAVAGLWRWPAVLLLAGLAGEALFMRTVVIRAHVDTATRAALGREQPAAFTFRNESARTLDIEFAPLTPAGFALPASTRRLRVPGAGSARDSFTLLPLRLGHTSWPPLPLRCLGAAGFAWWSRELSVDKHIAVAPDALRHYRVPPRGRLAGVRSRRSLGAGAELFQLRAYSPGDPLTRVDWKASARSGALVTREFSEDQHLDILIALDAGRFSRVRAGRLDRFGLYANITARFSQLATANEDRVGLVVFAERPLAVCAPDRGLRAVTHLQATLARCAAQPC